MRRCAAESVCWEANLSRGTRHLEQQFAEELHAALSDAPVGRADASFDSWKKKRKRSLGVALDNHAASAHRGVAHALGFVRQAAENTRQHSWQKRLERGPEGGRKEPHQREMAIAHGWT